MTTKQIRKEKLADLFARLAQSGAVIVAPVRKNEKVFFGQVSRFDEITLDFVQTALSAKSAVFPRCEELINYSVDGNSFKVNDPEFSGKEIVVFGLRPCDAATFGYLRDFFTKENPDVHFSNRMNRLTLISVACKNHDQFCFCTSVGSSPSDTRGADIALTEIDGGAFYAEAVSDKGNALVAKLGDVFSDSPAMDKAKYVTQVPEVFSLETLKSKLSAGVFESPTWMMNSLACLGCGACAFACPTCTCFDIQEESNLDGGKRIRSWDTCALSIFTAHTSGHNPRQVQSQRWRQRILHKFDYSEQTLNQVSCVGCGRCGRVCPAQMSILEQIKSITEA
jgi:ferredoxin